jgi:hypothetical protein
MSVAILTRSKETYELFGTDLLELRGYQARLEEWNVENEPSPEGWLYIELKKDPHIERPLKLD